MDKENKAKEEFELHIQWLDNGIVLAEPAFNVLECEKFENKGDASDMAMHKLIGRNVWEDIYEYFNKSCATNVKVTITLEEDV